MIACFVPSFEPNFQQQSEEDIVKEEEEPNSTKISDGSDYLFIFIVDRSGSMVINNRINIAVDALRLFLRSLPLNSKFAIVSFGSSHEWM